MTLLDARWLGLLAAPEFPWPANRAGSCSIKYRIAVWAARNGWVRMYRPRELVLTHNSTRRAAAQRAEVDYRGRGA